MITNLRMELFEALVTTTSFGPSLSPSLTDAEALSRLNTASLASTRVTIVAEDLAKPRDIAEYKETYENIMVVGSGTFGSVYCARLRDSEDGEEEE